MNEEIREHTESLRSDYEGLTTLGLRAKLQDSQTRWGDNSAMPGDREIAKAESHLVMEMLTERQPAQQTPEEYLSELQANGKNNSAASVKHTLDTAHLKEAVESAKNALANASGDVLRAEANRDLVSAQKALKDFVNPVFAKEIAIRDQRKKASEAMTAAQAAKGKVTSDVYQELVALAEKESDAILTLEKSTL